MKRIVPVTGEYLIVKKPESTTLRLKNALMYLRIRNSAVLVGLCYEIDFKNFDTFTFETTNFRYI
jgi:hypothetical protein